MEYNNFVVGNQGIKWARDGKEGMIALTSPDSEDFKSCEDNDCRFCAYHSICLENSATTIN